MNATVATTVWVWWIVNLDTGETKRSRAGDRATACALVGWNIEYCAARILRRA
jgi:hypothetical protein